MTISAALKRRYLRAPLNNEFLFEYEGDALKGRVKNISEGGILIHELQRVPEVNRFPLMIEIPTLPDFNKISNDGFMKFKSLNDFPSQVIRMRGRIVRSFKGQSETQKVFVDNIGCEFFDPEESNIKLIREYVSQYARNIIFLLNQFENNTGKNADLVRKIAILLGYHQVDRLPLLRQKVLHDYQSLESL
jgi:hypothetical protein